VFASIPSPSSGEIPLGPIPLHAYGLCIALGVLAAIWLSTRRWKARGGNPEDVSAIALWGVPGGVIGARIYHVITDFQLYRNDLGSAFEIWDGGLGIWGGIAGGAAAGALAARRRGVSVLEMLDVAAPGIVLAQAIGRFGNYFNQELFGTPTTLPWALEIDQINRPAEYALESTFHPLFLYESLWNLALCGALLFISSRWSLTKGNLFVLYVAGYTFARFFLEGMRVEFANEFAGLRVNEWMSIFVFVAALAVFVIRQRKHRTSQTEAGVDEDADVSRETVVPEGSE
jgi:prolipoprotein diacylglyceryl transferase